MKRVNDPTAGVVGRIFLDLLGIKTPKEISYKSGVGVVFEMKAKEDGSSVLLCLPKKGFYAGLLREVENKFYRAFDCKRFTITMEDSTGYHACHAGTDCRVPTEYDLVWVE